MNFISGFTEELGTIWNATLSFLYWLCDFLFGWINLPDFPETLKNSITVFFDLIFDNLTFLGFFIRPATLKIVIPLLIILLNFEYIYRFLMWIVHKLPFFNVR